MGKCNARLTLIVVNAKVVSRVTATTESVSSGWAQENQNGFKKDKACETYQEKGMEDFPIQVTVKVEGDEFLEKKMEKEVVDATRNEDSDLGEEVCFDGILPQIIDGGLLQIYVLLVVDKEFVSGGLLVGEN
ncbi:hypothetical protein HOLleu_15735 [Holothuria leucospilota]|uniref:Uncharacterized protein n=1 Tax=Holothuria leucospilota TaxID=206669 RepID=A0A9Q1HAL9_HOLLE|nr:hypothetical protein HOLleu_15735 [Holothuria leucospilota]